MFTADGVQGTSTVIAQLEPSRYAFFRGEIPLGPPPPAAKGEGKPAQGQPDADGDEATKSRKANLLEQLQRTNRDFQSKQIDRLQEMYESDEEGVAAEEAF